MGYTIYYRVKITRWSEFVTFIKRVCKGLRLHCEVEGETVKIDAEGVEFLIIPTEGEGFVKTYRKEPYTSLYLLIIYSASAFGSVEVWED
ncbi:hypothetical protein QDY65_00205 [Pyrococcus kukulkanii]|uniref:hypothetical protein n=1 Tax=Pyrococcus kukulkanii TaxID=1609559 RepID=UPI00356830B2